MDAVNPAAPETAEESEEKELMDEVGAARQAIIDAAKRGIARYTGQGVKPFEEWGEKAQRYYEGIFVEIGAEIARMLDAPPDDSWTRIYLGLDKKPAAAVPDAALLAAMRTVVDYLRFPHNDGTLAEEAATIDAYLQATQEPNR